MSARPRSFTGESTDRPLSQSSRNSSYSDIPNPDLLFPTSNPSSRKSTLESVFPPASNSKPLKKQRSNTGIAGALALSGVALASPSAQLRQPLGLKRVNSNISIGQQASNGGRDSLEDDHGDARSLGGQSEGGQSHLVSMDSLGDFDEVVSQLGTGYAVASSKRNADFHALFRNIPEDDYLIEDYGCALQREILIQGRLYISEHHLSFYANIFGWVTTLNLPFAEVVSIEKRMTAYVIPNAIQVTTLHSSHTFASFLSRDTTYNLIGNIWKTVHPVVPAAAALPDHDGDSETEDGASVISDSGGGGAGSAMTPVVVESATSVKKEKVSKRKLKGLRRRAGTGESEKTDLLTAPNGVSGGGGGGKSEDGTGGERKKKSAGGGGGHHPVTHDTCPTLKDLKQVCMDTVLPSSPEKIYNLMFTSGFMKGFWNENQKLKDIEMSDWAPEKSGSKLLARSMSYIKPLSGKVGPSETKCHITDETAHVDFDDYVCIVTTTRTPDVPSGGSFAVKTRTSMTWAKNNSTRVVVTTGVEWTKSSFLKSIIERSCIDGQKTYHVDLEKAMRSYISQHRSEFVEEGHSVDEEGESVTSSDAVEETPAVDESTTVAGLDANESLFGKLKGMGEALAGIGDLFGGVSLSTVILAGVIAFLVVSNLWTLKSRPSNTPAPTTRSNGGGGGGAKHRTPDEVALAMRSVLQDYFQPPPQAVPVAPVLERGTITWKEESEEIGRVLDRLEERIKAMREVLAEESGDEVEKERERQVDEL